MARSPTKNSRISSLFPTFSYDIVIQMTIRRFITVRFIKFFPKLHLLDFFCLHVVWYFAITLVHLRFSFYAFVFASASIIFLHTEISFTLVKMFSVNRILTSIPPSSNSSTLQNPLFSVSKQFRQASTMSVYMLPFCKYVVAVYPKLLAENCSR